MKLRHIDQSSNRIKQQLNWQGIHASSCSLIKKRLQLRCFPENFGRFFRALFLCMIIYIQSTCSKNLVKFTAKVTWTATSTISENRPCLVGCKFIYVLKNWLLLSIQGIEPFHWVWVLHWWTPNQRIEVDDATQMITEVYLDVQVAVRKNFWIQTVWLTSLKCCIRAWVNAF